MAIAREIVLPSGRFAAFRKIAPSDLIATWSENVMRMTAQLVARIATIDGKAITFEEIEVMELDDFMPLCAIVGDLMPAAGLGRGVA
jgi:hypothetical protein